MKTTTLNRIKSHRPCMDGWEKLLKHLGKTKADDEPLPYSVIVESNGINDALWCCRVEPQYDRDWLLFAVWCARQVQHLMMDRRSIHAIDVAERYAQGQATDEELGAAWAAAWYSRAGAGAGAGGAAGAAARAAAGVGAGDAAGDAAGAAARAAARAAAWDAAWDAAWAAQTKKFLQIVEEQAQQEVT